MSARRKRSVVDYVICAIGALFICLYASLAFQPVAQTEQTEPEPIAETQEESAQEPESEFAPEPEAEADSEPELSDLTVTFIDVGQGDSALIQLPDGKVMLIDAGEASSSHDVLEALEAAGVDEIDYLIASHPHADHIGGMEAVLDAYDVGEVWAPDAPGDTETYEGFLDAVDEEGLTITAAEEGAEIVSDDAGYSVDVLAPADGTESEDMNDYSVIVRITYGDTSFLFTGDATSQEVVDASPGHVDVLKAAHHGSETGTNEDVMTETSPEIVVMSYEEGNSYGHPDQSTLDAISAIGAAAYSTAANGDVTVVSDGEQVTVTTEKDGTIAAGVSAEEKARQEAEAEAQAQAEAEAQVQAEAEAQAQAEAEAEAEAQTETQTQQSEKTVVVTPTGEKYHRVGCRTLWRSKTLTELTVAQAIARGYGACKVCAP